MRPRTILRLYLAFVFVLMGVAAWLRSPHPNVVEMGGMEMTILPPSISVPTTTPPPRQERRAPAPVRESRTELSLVSEETAATTTSTVQPAAAIEPIEPVIEPIEPVGEPVPVTTTLPAEQEAPPPPTTTTVPPPPELIEPIVLVPDPLLPI